MNRTISLCANEWVILNKIISVDWQYLKLFCNCVLELSFWYYIATLGNFWLWANDWIVLINSLPENKWIMLNRIDNVR